MHLEVIKETPSEVAHPNPILFIHGMWHAAWCWTEYFLPYFSQHGYITYALSLRGHGSSEGNKNLRWSSLDDYLTDVTQVIRQMEKPPILVGHSMGGMIIQKYLEKNKTPAAVLLASTPPKGVLATTARIFFRHPHQLRLPMRPNNRSLNLSNAVAAVCFEAWRQHGFSGAQTPQPARPQDP